MPKPIDIAGDRGAPIADRLAAIEAAARAVAGADPPSRHAIWSVLFKIVLDKREDSEVREAAAWAGRHAALTAANNLVAHAVPDAPSVRRAMVRALAEIARQPLPDYFEGRIREDLATLDGGLTLTPFVNLTLTYGAEPRAVAAVRRGLADADPRIRRSALFQLSAVGDLAPAVAALTAGSAAPAEDRVAAAEALGHYWTGEPKAASALAAAAEDEDEDVARAATVARRRLKLAAAPRPGRRGRAVSVAEGAAPWSQFLTRWSGELLQVEEFALQQDDAVIESGWLGRPPATEAELTALEARLGRRLPPSYRSFLATTNGFLGGGPSIRRIRPAAEVRPFVEEEADWVQVWTRQGAAEWEPLTTAMQVSDVGDGAVYLLCPDAAGADGEWEAWLFASWIPGAHRHASWWDLLQAEHRSFVELEHPPEQPA